MIFQTMYGNSQDSFFGVSHDRLPVGTIPLLAVSSAPAYADALGRFARAANDAHAEFLASEDGRGFCGQVRRKKRIVHKKAFSK